MIINPQFYDEFKLVVCGGRNFNDEVMLNDALSKIKKYFIDNSIKLIIISGMAKGADTLAHNYAKDNNIECIECPAKWSLYGSRAGPIRNEEMLNMCDGVVAFWDKRSPGTEHMISIARKQNKLLEIIEYAIL